MSVATGLDSSCCPTDYGGERVGVVCFMAPPLASSHPSLQRNTDRNQTNTVSANAGSRKNSRAAEKNKCIYKVECVLPLLAGRWAPSWIWFGQKVFQEDKNHQREESNQLAAGGQLIGARFAR